MRISSINNSYKPINNRRSTGYERKSVVLENLTTYQIPSFKAYSLNYLKYNNSKNWLLTLPKEHKKVGEKICSYEFGQELSEQIYRKLCSTGVDYSDSILKLRNKIIETSCSGAGIAYLDESAMDPEFRAKDNVVQLVYNTAKNKCGGDKYNLPDETWARMIANSYGVSCIVVRDGIYVNGTIVKDMNLSVDDKGTTAISPCIEDDKIQAYMPCVTYKGAGCI